MEISRLGTILGIWAHPDDEVVLSGGIMAAAKANGQRVVVVTATTGQAGVSDTWPAEGLAEMRAGELTASLQLLGVSELIWLGCPDGGCQQVPSSEIVIELESIINELRPDSILTFGSDGWTGHPDHCAVSGWVTAAWHKAKPSAKLYYSTVTPDWLGQFGPAMRPQAYYIKTLPPTAPSELAINFHLSPDIWSVKLKAIQAHQSQVDSITRTLGDDFLQIENQTECFRLYN